MANWTFFLQYPANSALRKGQVAAFVSTLPETASCSSTAGGPAGEDWRQERERQERLSRAFIWPDDLRVTSHSQPVATAGSSFHAWTIVGQLVFWVFPLPPKQKSHVVTLVMRGESPLFAHRYRFRQHKCMIRCIVKGINSLIQVMKFWCSNHSHGHKGVKSRTQACRLLRQTCGLFLLLNIRQWYCYKVEEIGNESNSPSKW